MPNYIPIMKSRPAELTAWSNRSTAVAGGATPLFEIAFKSTKKRPTVDDYLEGLSPDLIDAVGAGNTVIDDGFTIDQMAPAAHTADRFIPWISDDLDAGGVHFIPVVRLSDPPALFGDASDAAATHGHGVMLRLGDAGGWPDLAAFRARVPSLLRVLKIRSDELHVLLDYQAIDDHATLAAVIPHVDVWLADLATSGPYASITVASGAFPDAITDLPTAAPAHLPRLDAQVYNGLTVPAGMDVDYADFHINHPSHGPSVPRGPLPNLRYAADDHWLVWRERRDPAIGLVGNRPFYIVCENIVKQPEWAGAAFSWGDGEVDVRVGFPNTIGSGAAKEWRAYGVSHHLQTVVHRLATLGAP